VRDIGFRRLALTAIIATSAFGIISNLSAKDAVDTLIKTLVAMIGLSLVAGVVYPAGAVHQAGGEVALIGNWKGIFLHKNVAGSVSAVSAIMCAPTTRKQRTSFMMFGFAASLAMLWLSQSKSSLA